MVESTISRYVDKVIFKDYLIKQFETIILSKIAFKRKHVVNPISVDILKVVI
jgi:hypothetical protein